MTVHSRKVVGWTWLFTIFAAVNSSAQARRPKYTVAQSFALDTPVNGIEGTLQLLMDERLGGAVREELWGKGDWSFVLAQGSMLYKAFSTLPPGNSQLRIAGSAGEVIARRNLGTALAKLEAWETTAGSNRFFLLTEDYSTRAGSYNGLATILLRVLDGAFHDATALGSASNREERFRLMKSLKSDWRISSRGNGGEILSVSCHPNKTGDFVIDYFRYSLEGTRWRKCEREVGGFWE